MKYLQAAVVFTGTRNRDALQQTTARQKVKQQGRACSYVAIMGHDFAAISCRPRDAPLSP